MFSQEKLFLSASIVLGLFFLSLPGQALAAFAGGTGTVGNPYQIETCLQLQQATSSLSSNYILNNDIDCSDTTNWNSGAGFVPIGSSAASKFSGSFNGNGHRITGLYIYRPTTDNVGLFGYTDTTSNIYRLGVSGANITGQYSVGGLIGYNKGTSSENYAIANVTTTVNAGAYTGGLIGTNAGPVTNCFSRGTVNGGASSPIGGLIGLNSSPAVVTNSFAASVVNGTNGGYGLIAAHSANPPTNSFWDQNVSGKATSDGGTGTTTQGLNLASTFSAWDLTTIWGIDDDHNNGYPYLRNNNPGVDTIREVANVTDLQNISLYPGDRFIQVADIDATSTLSWNAGQGFTPINQFYGKYDGNGFTITNLTISSSTRDYVGVFGQNRGVVTNFKIADSSVTGHTYVGAIAGYNYGTISKSQSYRLNNYSNQVTGYSETGGLIGRNFSVGLVSQSFAISNITSSWNNASTYVAGLVGYNAGTISNCYARGTVTGGSSAGIAGLVGYNLSPATITNSYAASIITGTAGLGLIYSKNSGDFLTSFSDINISGKTNSGGGTATTTLALNTASTFSSWDMSAVWAIDANRNLGYPYLRNNDPGVDQIIQIATVADLQNIALNPGGRFIQTADIDATSTISWNAGQGFVPISQFYGKYEGNGFIITNLTISSSTMDYVGVFGQNRGTINNFKIADSVIAGHSYVGGVVGYNWGTLYRSKLYRYNNSSSAVTGYSYVGGLAGYNSTYGILSQSYAVSIVTTTWNSATDYTAGLVGYNAGTVTNCYARGSVNGGNVAGIAGLTAFNLSPAIISNSFAASVINGDKGTGFIYSASAAPINSFCDITVAGKGCGYGTGTTTAAMKILTTFTNVGWDFASGNIWHMDPEGLKDDGYPYLNPPVLPAIEVWNVTDLQNIAVNPDRNYIQMADFDAGAAASWNGGAGFAPINTFTGVYDGNGFHITNLTINRPTEDYVGVFAQNRGVINDFKIADSSFTGRTYVGSIVGYNQGTVYRSQSYRLNNSSNQVTGYSNTGGLVGYNSLIGNISQSYAISNVTASWDSSGAFAGGLIGYNAGSVSNCYARGAVSGSSRASISGLIATNISPANVSNSYAAVTVSGTAGAGLIYSQSILPTNSFWDTQVSGKSGSAGGTGTTTSAMKTLTTFTNVGWDFSTIWGLQPAENEGYPYLLAGAPSYVSLIINRTGQGTTTVDGSTYSAPVSFASGTVVSLVAIPDTHWSFVSWEDSSTSTSRSVTMDSDKNLSVTFSEDPYILTISHTGSGSITVDGSTYSSPLTLTAGSSTSLLATPASGWSFGSWDDGSTSTSRLVTMDSNKTLSATFTQNPVTLTLNHVGNGSLTVDGLAYSAPLIFDAGTSTVLEAIPASGWSFVSWDDGSTSPNYFLLMDSNKDLTATFNENPVVSIPSATTSPRHSSGTSIQSRVANLISMGNHQAAEDLKKQWPQLFPVASTKQTLSSASQNSKIVLFTQNLSLNSVHPEVKRLQQYLNTHGFVVAQSGPGSPGRETNKFGALTKKALIKFQETYAKEILLPFGLKKGTGLFGSGTRNKLNQILTH